MISSGLAIPLIPDPRPMKNLPAMKMPVAVAPDCNPAPRATIRLPMRILYFRPIQSARLGAIGNAQTEPTD